MIQRQVRRRTHLTRPRVSAARLRRRRTLAILVAGAGAWSLLALVGLDGAWTRWLLIVAVISLLAWNGQTTRQARRGRSGQKRLVRGEQAPGPVRAERPRAVSEEYNTVVTEAGLNDRKAPGRREEAAPVRLETKPATKVVSIPPVPPPLYGRPGSRPLVAGQTPSPRPVAAESAQGPETLPRAEGLGEPGLATGAEAAAEPERSDELVDAARKDAPTVEAEQQPAADLAAPGPDRPASASGADPVPGVSIGPIQGPWMVADPDTADLTPAPLTAPEPVSDSPPARVPSAVSDLASAVPEAAPDRVPPPAVAPKPQEETEPALPPAPNLEPQAAPEPALPQATDPAPQAAPGPVPAAGQASPQAQAARPSVPSGTPAGSGRGAINLTAPATTYVLPPLHMLPLPRNRRGVADEEVLERAALLERTLKTFGVEARVVDFSFGPAVTRYELQPAPGVRVNKFTALADDLCLALAAEGIRIEAPIPGKSAVGIEVPNKERLTVPLREVLESEAFRTNPSKLTVALGKDNAGNPVVGDLARMPHLLIAGATGSGKSVCMNTIIASLLFKARPDEVKMLMIDPKMVELSIYNGIPHLIAPVITDVRKAAGYLKWAVKEMESRYELFAAAGVRNIQQYNQMVAAIPGPDPDHPRLPLPYIVIFIDELADLMMVAPAEVEDSICRLAQMARACGMHLVIATQSPRVDVITGLIKANIPSRIAFAVSSQVDSRVILDSAGAERLLGRGDMLYHPAGLPKPIRAQGAFIEESAVEELVRFVKAQGKPVYTAEEVAVEVGPKRGGRNGEESAPGSAVEAVFPQAVRIVIEHGQASVSILQRRLRCNYAKATRLIDMMEERGFIGPHQGSKPREVLISMARWRELFGDGGAGEEA